MTERPGPAAPEVSFTGRGLSQWMLEEFIERGGLLRPVLDEVLRPGSGLELEIRRRYVNIYFKGGNLMRIRQTGRRGHAPALVAEFDERYLLRDDALRAAWRHPDVLGARELRTTADVRNHLDSFDDRRRIIEVFTKRERDAQQEIVRANNSADGEYLICDIEHSVSHPRPGRKPGESATKSSRFDLVAAYRPSGRADGPARLALIELKDGTGAMDGTAGLREHVADLNEWLADPARLQALSAQMVRLMDQKLRLGVVPATVASFDDRLVDYIIAVTHHNPRSQRLRDAILGRDKLDDQAMAVDGLDVKIAIFGDDHVLRHEALFPLESISADNMPPEIFCGKLKPRRYRKDEQLARDAARTSTD